MDTKAGLRRKENPSSLFRFVAILLVVLALLMVAVCAMLPLVKPKQQTAYGIGEPAATAVMAVQDQRINLNTATLEEIMQIPGIGEKTAQAILDFREENGGFSYVEDLLSVSGIGQARLETIKAIVYIGQ